MTTVQTTPTSSTKGGRNRTGLQKDKEDEEKATQRRLEEEKADMLAEKKREKEAKEAVRVAEAEGGGRKRRMQPLIRRAPSPWKWQINRAERRTKEKGS